MRKKNKAPKLRGQYPAYEWLKREWIANHPGATAREYEQAMRVIANRCGV